ncbi:MAG: HAD-IIIC family phosphatase [Pseudomonadota bacterium]
MRAVVGPPLSNSSATVADPSANGDGGEAASASSPETIVAASFTIDPVIDAAPFWVEVLNAPFRLVAAPFAQVLPQLLDPRSVLRQADAGRVIAFRWCDLAAEGDVEPVEAAATRLMAALGSAADARPTLIIVCPEVETSPDRYAPANDRLRAFAHDHPSFTVRDLGPALKTYRVTEPFDPIAAAAANLPFRREAMAAMGALIARWRAAALRPPVKLIAVDGDNTLWDGVLGEDGVSGVGLSPGKRALQSRLSDAVRDGAILCLLTKNDRADIDRLLAERTDFPLRAGDFLAIRADWTAKSEHLAELAQAYAVAHESIVFIDDNPVECAAMSAALPSVTVVRAPMEASAADCFADHLWVLDRAPTTEADRQRVARYRDEQARSAAMADATSLTSFFDELALDITIRDAVADDAPRLAQMALRTNQFNATLERRDEAAFRTEIDMPNRFTKIVSVKDKFGDYGVVGSITAQRTGDDVAVDLCTLSCRALGRGVEHAMLADLAQSGKKTGARTLRLPFVIGPRNTPYLAFVRHVTGVQPTEDGVATLDIEAAAALTFDPARDLALGGSAPNSSESASPKNAASTNDRTARVGRADHQRIAETLTTGAAIVTAARGAVRSRPDALGGYVAPKSDIERLLSEIWTDVLHIDRVGVSDRFQDLGGKSIHLARIFAALPSDLRRHLNLADLFQFGSIKTLAEHLSMLQATDEKSDQQENRDRVGWRGEKMRAVRRRPAPSRAAVRSGVRNGGAGA